MLSISIPMFDNVCWLNHVKPPLNAGWTSISAGESSVESLPRCHGAATVQPGATVRSRAWELCGCLAGEGAQWPRGW